MILNEEQTLAIQQKLNYAVKYKETYDEVYDHVITAIDHLPQQNTETITLINQIIEHDFGGYSTLGKTEEARAKQVNIVMRKKHWHNMMRFFNIPFIGVTLAITVAAFFIAANPHTRRVLITICAVSSTAPLFFVVYKRLSAKYRQWKFDIYQKQSLKDNYIFISAILSNSLFNLVNAANKQIIANGGITMFVFVFYMVYVSGFFKLYNDEFKMNLAGN